MKNLNSARYLQPYLRSGLLAVPAMSQADIIEIEGDEDDFRQLIDR